MTPDGVPVILTTDNPKAAFEKLLESDFMALPVKDAVTNK